MHIAVLGDLHGNILLAFKRCARWQQKTGQQLDLILQVGDLGVFPDRTRLDRATRRHSKHAPAVLGFQEFFTASHPEVKAILGTISADLLFVRGNHEDHTWLDALEQQATGPRFPVDVYQRLWCLKTGVPYAFRQADETLSILGIGRIGQPASARRIKPHFIQPSEQHRLEQLDATPIDVLLSHDAPRDASYPGSGSPEVGHALRRHRPQYHFFGHYGGPSRHHLDANDITQSYKLADLAGEARFQGQVPTASAMGILHWRNRDTHAFESLDASWLTEDLSALARPGETSLAPPQVG